MFLIIWYLKYFTIKCILLNRSEKRQFVPAMDQYFEDAIMAADPANQIEDTYK